MSVVTAFQCDGCGRREEQKGAIPTALPWAIVGRWGGAFKHACSAECLKRVAVAVVTEWEASK